MSRHVALNMIRRVCQAVREPAVSAREQDMRTPAIAGHQDERACTVLARRARVVIADGMRHGDTRAPLVERKTPDECLVMKLEVLAGQQLLERPVGRIAGTGRTDLARVAPMADAAAVVAFNRILRLRR